MALLHHYDTLRYELGPGDLYEPEDPQEDTEDEDGAGMPLLALQSYADALLHLAEELCATTDFNRAANLYHPAGCHARGFLIERGKKLDTQARELREGIRRLAAFLRELEDGPCFEPTEDGFAACAGKGA